MSTFSSQRVPMSSSGAAYAKVPCGAMPVARWLVSMMRASPTSAAAASTCCQQLGPGEAYVQAVQNISTSHSAQHCTCAGIFQHQSQFSQHSVGSRQMFAELHVAQRSTGAPIFAVS